MTQRPAISSTFPRSTRAIHADSLAPGLAILIILLLLMLGGGFWLVLFKVPFYQTSQSAHITPEATIVAEFTPDVLPQIQVGQEAVFVPDSETGSLNETGNPLSATVVEVDPDLGQVWLLLTAERDAQSQLAVGMSGQVRVVVEEQSPLALIVKSVGMDLST
jgi:hypothetical protein